MLDQRNKQRVNNNSAVDLLVNSGQFLIWHFETVVHRTSHNLFSLILYYNMLSY